MIIILFGKNSFQVGISSTSAELVYSTVLCLHGEIFSTSVVADSPDHTHFVMKLKSHFRSIHPQSL